MMTKPLTFMELGEVARKAEVSKATAVVDIRRGFLKPSALTTRGGRLFSDEDLAAYLKARQCRRGG